MRNVEQTAIDMLSACICTEYWHFGRVGQLIYTKHSTFRVNIEELMFRFISAVWAPPHSYLVCFCSEKNLLWLTWLVSLKWFWCYDFSLFLSYHHSCTNVYGSTTSQLYGGTTVVIAIQGLHWKWLSLTSCQRQIEWTDWKNIWHDWLGHQPK